MAKLYELTENYNNLLELLDNPDVPQDVIQKSLDSVAEEIEVKAENIAKLIKSIDSDVNGLKGEEKRLADRRKALENRVESLKGYLFENMRATGHDKIKGSVFTLAISKNPPKLNISDMASIPKQYFVMQEPLLDKETLKKELKAGKEINGAELQQSESLRIR